MSFSKNDLLLYAVTDRAWAGKQTFIEQVECALKGGATCIQIREKHLDNKDFLNEALQVKALCRQYNVPFIVNDNAEIALKCGADGIHVGQHDMDASDVRALIGDKMILGVSAQSVEQAIKAEKHGADYLGVGAVFPTATKADADYVPYETLKQICSAVNIPVVAIGGISKGNINMLSGSGVDGVALISAIFSAPDIEKECRELRRLSELMIKA